MFRLYLKSPSHDGDKSRASEYVNLCTPTTTYALRQVNSSNSIFVIKPNLEAGEERHGVNEKGVEDGDAGGRRGTVMTIAQCKSTLELHKAGDGDSAPLFLHKLAPVYDITDAEADTIELHNAMDVDGEGGGDGVEMLHGAARARAQLFADIPVSFSECRHAWVEDCAFVHRDPGLRRWVCRRPSAAVKLLVWKKLLEGAVLHEINLEKQFLVSDLWKAMIDDEDAPIDTASGPFPRPLFEAVVRRLMDGSSSEITKDIDSRLKCEDFQYSKVFWANINGCFVYFRGQH